MPVRKSHIWFICQADQFNQLQCTHIHKECIQILNEMKIPFSSKQSWRVWIMGSLLVNEWLSKLVVKWSFLYLHCLFPFSVQLKWILVILFHHLLVVCYYVLCSTFTLWEWMKGCIHLSRMLSYSFSIDVLTIDSNYMPLLYNCRPSRWWPYWQPCLILPTEPKVWASPTDGF